MTVVDTRPAEVSDCSSTTSERVPISPTLLARLPDSRLRAALRVLARRLVRRAKQQVDNNPDGCG